MTARPLLLSLLLPACAGDPEPAAQTGDTAAVDTGEPWVEPPRDDPYIDDPVEPDPAAFDAETVAALIEESILVARSLSAEPVLQAYFESMETAEEGCPTWTSDGGVEYWLGGCTTSSGATFEGYGTSVLYDDTPDGDILWDGAAVFGVGSIEAGGATFSAGGQAGLLSGVNGDGALVYYSYTTEGFAYDGPAAAGTWLAEGLSPELVTYALHDDASGGKAMYLTGRIEVPDGPVEAVVFEDLLLINEAFGSACPGEPSGGLSVLGADGWYDLTFEGPEFGEGEGFDTTACDGCGEAWHKGVQIGTACVDFSAMTSWSVHPWEDAGVAR